MWNFLPQSGGTFNTIPATLFCDRSSRSEWRPRAIVTLAMATGSGVDAAGFCCVSRAVRAALPLPGGPEPLVSGHPLWTVERNRGRCLTVIAQDWRRERDRALLTLDVRSVQGTCDHSKATALRPVTLQPSLFVCKFRSLMFTSFLLGILVSIFCSEHLYLVSF